MAVRDRMTVDVGIAVAADAPMRMKRRKWQTQAAVVQTTVTDAKTGAKPIGSAPVLIGNF